MRRILVADPDSDVRHLLETTLARLGYEPVRATAGEPPPRSTRSCWSRRQKGHSLLRRFGAAVPPVICLSIYPREAGLEPPGSFAYLVKPSTRAQLGATLGLLFAV